MRKLGFIIFALLIAGRAGAATTSGTCSVVALTYSNWSHVTWTWTSDANGNVINDTGTVIGEIQQITFQPNSGSTSPTANYDVTIEDLAGRDILYGLGANRSESASEAIQFGDAGASVFTNAALSQSVNTNNLVVPWRPTNYGIMTLKITNAGNAKGGKIRMIVRR